MPYATPPGPRIAYDIDGTAVLIKNTADRGSIINDVDQTSKNLMNSEIPLSSVFVSAYGSVAPDGSIPPVWTGVMPNGAWLAFIFPTPMQINGILAIFGYGYVGVEMQVSSDSTNGDDGSWTSLGEVKPADQSPPYVGTRSFGDNFYSINNQFEPSSIYFNLTLPAINDEYRRVYNVDGLGIRTLTGGATRNVKAVRLYASGITMQGSSTAYLPMKIHLYGSPDSGALTDRVEFWQIGQDLATPAGWFDWGNAPLSSSADKSFRLKNNSLSKTATNVLVSALPGLTPVIPAPHTFLYFSVDAGATWSSTCVVAALSPGAVSSTILLRRVVPSNAPLSNWSPRLAATVGSWT